MSKFVQKKKTLPAINTASLPDIVFMLLFFFMVTTTMRKQDIMVSQQLPSATEVKKLEHKSLVNTIYIGKANDTRYGADDQIQLNDKLASVADIPTFIYSEREKRSKEEIQYMTTSIKADIHSNMGTINGVQLQLREVNALKVNFSSHRENQ